MRGLAAVLLLAALPVAAGATFLAVPTPPEAALACGSDACFPLTHDEHTVAVQGGERYAFLDIDGAPIERGPLCAPAMLPVPEGAMLLVVTPGTCQR